MILVDANLLINASVERLPQHEAALAWLDAGLSGTGRVRLPWPSLLTYLRIVSNPRIFERPPSVGAAWGQVEAWLSCEPVREPRVTGQPARCVASTALWLGLLQVTGRRPTAVERARHSDHTAVLPVHRQAGQSLRTVRWS